jgi:hypothetical protein
MKTGKLAAAATLAACLCSGCAAWTPETIAEESVQQAAQVVDLGQTLDIRRQPITCDPEGCWFPQESMARGIIGPHPKDAAVWKFKAAEMAGHWAVTEALVELHAPPWMTRTWEFVTIGVQTGVDVHNLQLGAAITF